MVPEMDNVLFEYVNRLVMHKRLPQGIEVYQKANRYIEAALLAYDVSRTYNVNESTVLLNGCRFRNMR